MGESVFDIVAVLVAERDPDPIDVSKELPVLVMDVETVPEVDVVSVNERLTL